MHAHTHTPCGVQTKGSADDVVPAARQDTASSTSSGRQVLAAASSAGPRIWELQEDGDTSARRRQWATVSPGESAAPTAADGLLKAPSTLLPGVLSDLRISENEQKATPVHEVEEGLLIDLSGNVGDGDVGDQGAGPNNDSGPVRARRFRGDTEASDDLEYAHHRARQGMSLPALDSDLGSDQKQHITPTGSDIADQLQNTQQSDLRRVSSGSVKSAGKGGGNGQTSTGSGKSRGVVLGIMANE